MRLNIDAKSRLTLFRTLIKYLHNLKLIDGKPLAKKSLKGVWLEILQIDVDFGDKGIVLKDLFKKCVGMGDKTFCWKDVWCGDTTLKDIFLNLCVVESNKNCLVLDRVVVMSNSSSWWPWN